MLGFSAFAGCELPSELPKWNTTWVVPGETSTVQITSLLPAGVELTEDGSALVARTSQVSGTYTLADLCSACGSFSGVFVPKPAFTADVKLTAPLPSAIRSAAVTRGTVRVELEHDFSFDPLRPGPTSRGYLVLTVSSGSTVLARDSINGRDVAFPPGTTLVRELTLAAGTVAGSVDIGVKLHSPAGEPVMVDSRQSLRVTVPPAEIVVSQAQVQLSSEGIVLETTELDLEDVDEGLIERLKGGALRLTIDNPLDVTGHLDLTITAPGGVVIPRTVQLQKGVSDQRIALDQQELRSILGKPGVTLSAGGQVSTPTGGTTITANSTIQVTTRLEVTVGGSEEI